MSDQDLIAKFLETKKVTKVAEGSRAIKSDKEIYAAMQEGVRARPTGAVAAETAQQVSETLAEAAVEAAHLGHRVIGMEDGFILVQSDVDDFYHTTLEDMK
jgi:hypothetical protein